MIYTLTPTYPWQEPYHIYIQAKKGYVYIPWHYNHTLIVGLVYLLVEYTYKGLACI